MGGIYVGRRRGEGRGRGGRVGKEVGRKIKGRGINTSMKKQAETVTKGIEMRRKAKRANLKCRPAPPQYYFSDE